MFIKLNNDFKIDREKNKETPPNQELTLSWIRHALISGYPSLKSDQRRILTRIMEKIEDAEDDKSEYLEINTFEFHFMKTAFENGITKSEHAKYVTIAEDAFLNATDTLPVSDAKA